MRWKPTAKDLIPLVPEGVLDRSAVIRGLSLIPPRRIKDYAGKLQDATQRPGIIHELRVLGKLSSKRLRGFSIHPPEKGQDYDALLTITGTEAELEVTALVKPAYDAAVGRVCRRIELQLASRFPSRGFEVHLGNIGAGFPTRIDAQGNEMLDEDGLMAECQAQLEQAITSEGAISPGWTEERVYGPITSVKSNDVNRVRQMSYVLPADAHVGQAKRKVFHKVDKPQWSGARPAILAVVLEHHPVTDLLSRPYDHVADQAFAKCPYLAAIVALPFGNFMNYPAIFYRRDSTCLEQAEKSFRSTLERAFRFWIGVDWHWALGAYKEMRRGMQQKGSWPGWEQVRFGANRETASTRAEHEAEGAGKQDPGGQGSEGGDFEG